MSFKGMDVRAVANAIEADAGEAIPDLVQALEDAKSGSVGRITATPEILVLLAREKSRLTKTLFAERIRTPLATVLEWEKGLSVPPGGVMCLLRILVRHPELFNELT